MLKRYENNNFYSEGNNRPIVVLCSNTTSPQPTEFRKAAEELLSDLQIAAPRATNYYAASTRKVAAGNATVYAFAQCQQNISQSDCSKCLQLRTVYSCLPTTSGRSMDNGCFTRYDTTPFFGRNETTDILSLLRDGETSILQELLLQGPAAYSYTDLKVATDNFSDENKLGGGMHGEVYKGTLENGDEVAIKKTFLTSSRGKKHFKDELKILGNVHHRHLLRLLGYCRKGPDLFLVHEYMENHSLDQFLYGDKTTTLSWKQRFGIIYGTARGLAYLHEQYHVTVIHRDIKTSNILLDNEFQPKIADFGLIRLLPEDKTRLSTELAGSLNSGYVAPEYAIHGHLSEKVDTYSYGVVVLEIVSGKRCKEVIHNKSDTPNLVDHAWNLYESGTHLSLVDDKLDPSEYSTEEVHKIIEIALMCTQPTVSARPAMSEVVTLLSDNTLEERPRLRSTTYDEVKIQVAMESSIISNTIAVSQW
ncbi:putative protein kinase RLK-Pelle-DLSV family [Helianthus anomalus]